MTTTTTTTQLPHTGLRTPDDRLKVTSLKTLNTSCGVAHTSTLRRDSKPVGTIENEGRGGMTQFHSKYVRTDPKALTEAALEAYAEQCRTDSGLTVTVEDLLNALVDEFEWSKKADKATRRGDALLRLMEVPPVGDDGEPFMEPYATHERTWGMPAERLDLEQAGKTLMARATPPPFTWWQVFRGGVWVDVTERPATAPAALR